MGQLIHLPIRPPAYPDRSADLDAAECVLLMSIRWWVADRKARVDPLPRLCQALGNAGASDAAFSVDRLMEAVARHNRRQIEIHCPRCAAVSDDEKHLLHIASVAQLGDRILAERLLRMTLVTERQQDLLRHDLQLQRVAGAPGRADGEDRQRRRSDRRGQSTAGGGRQDS